MLTPPGHDTGSTVRPEERAAHARARRTTRLVVACAVIVGVAVAASAQAGRRSVQPSEPPGAISATTARTTSTQASAGVDARAARAGKGDCATTLSGGSAAATQAFIERASDVLDSTSQSDEAKVLALFAAEQRADQRSIGSAKKFVKCARHLDASTAAAVTRRLRNATRGPSAVTARSRENCVAIFEVSYDLASDLYASSVDAAFNKPEKQRLALLLQASRNFRAAVKRARAELLKCLLEAVSDTEDPPTPTPGPSNCG